MSANALITETAPICPRCAHYIPSDEEPGAYPGAMSRADDETEVCSSCGSEEGLLDFAASVKAGRYVRATSKVDWLRPDLARSKLTDEEKEEERTAECKEVNSMFASLDDANSLN
jgi:hypothetical protein